MKKCFVSFCAMMLIAAPLAIGQTSTWTPDKTHSEVDFSILHLGLSKVHGRFGNIGGSITLDEADSSKSTVNVTIDVSTVDTGVAARDNDLKGTSFFDVAQFPTATFVSTNVTRSGSSMTVSGDLTLHGITKPVTLEVEGPTGPLVGMDKKSHSGYSAKATISRTAFGIGSKVPNAVVGDEVLLTIDLDLAKQ
jgi:polyisoprenoid-binding protein YceI